MSKNRKLKALGHAENTIKTAEDKLTKISSIITNAQEELKRLKLKARQMPLNLDRIDLTELEAVDTIYDTAEAVENIAQSMAQDSLISAHDSGRRAKSYRPRMVSGYSEDTNDFFIM